MHPIYCDIYFVLPSAFDILRYILSCRAIAIYDLPINLRYIYKRVSPLVSMLKWMGWIGVGISGYGEYLKYGYGAVEHSCRYEAVHEIAVS